MKDLKQVYVAGPYTNPDPIVNTHIAVNIGMDLYESGLAYPVVPHVTMLMHFLRPHTDVEFWYEFDLHALKRCDAVYRFPGASSGADREVVYAESLGIPVFFELDALEKWLRED